MINSRALSVLAKCLATKLHSSFKLLLSSRTPPGPLSWPPGPLDTVFQMVSIGNQSDSVSPLVTSILLPVTALKFEVAWVFYHLPSYPQCLPEFSPPTVVPLFSSFPLTSNLFQTNPKGSGLGKTFRTALSREGSRLLTT